MKKFPIRSILSVIILVVTIAMLVWYVTSHPEYIQTLLKTDLKTVLWLFIINSLLIATLIGIYQYTVQIAGKRLGHKENVLLTIYSSIANFFGPLQSGPGIRAVYLKKKHSIRLRDYTFATLIYYAIYAIINAFFMLVGTRPWWQTLLAVIGAAGFSMFCLRWFQKKDKQTDSSKFNLSPRLLTGLIIFTFIQTSLLVTRYYVDLQATGAPISIGQAVSYTGTANMALFVSITPDGIGIRETFLLFTQKLHGVRTENVITASLIDRASYVLFLVILFIFALSFHAKEKLNFFKSKDK